MDVSFETTRVLTTGGVEHGSLIRFRGVLAAVVVQLNHASYHDEDRGRWFVETGFGPLEQVFVPTFETLTDAGRWICNQMQLSSLLRQR